MKMRQYFNPIVLTLTLVILGGYFYTSFRLTEDVVFRIILFFPFFSVWIVPVRYWMSEREDNKPTDRAIHLASYLSMGWLSFLFILLIFRDLCLLLANMLNFSQVENVLSIHGRWAVFTLSFLALFLGMLRARRGPCIRIVDIPIEGLNEQLDGFCIVQISDLHVSHMIKRKYVEEVVRMTREFCPDLIALTGDIVDGKVADLAAEVEPLKELALDGRAFLVLGNHDYYAGAHSWTEHFRFLGLKVLLNSHMIVRSRKTKILVAGVIDPAAKIAQPFSKPDPALALTQGDSTPDSTPDLRILLAHNPKIALEAERAGFDLQLSGHTHAGQFIPWTLVVRFVHQPHYWGLSKQGRMWVYVSAGTGTWGPPIRLGTEPELTVIRLSRANSIS